MKGRRDNESEGEAYFNLDRPVRHRAASSSARRILAVRPASSTELPPQHSARTPADLLRLLPSTAASLSPAGRVNNSSSSSAFLGATIRLPAAAAVAGIDGVVAAGAASAGTGTGASNSGGASQSDAASTVAPSSEEPAGAAGLVEHSSTSSLRRSRHLTYHDLIRWIQKEMGRRAASKARRRADQLATATARQAADRSELATAVLADEESVKGLSAGASDRRVSDSDSDGSVALDMLRDMLEHQMMLRSRRSSHSLKSLRKRRRHSTAASSDTDFYDSDTFVPSCDAVLDNSKTLPYAIGTVREYDERPDMSRAASARQREAWKTFKYEIVRLAHTFKLKGWRRIPLDQSSTVDVVRLSGALTNAVYVVTPPQKLPVEENGISKRLHKSNPQKLLLRIYGSQVEHLIDRENELQILRRLARKRIGPRLLGTFMNGRFEEFFNARALRSEDLRVPDISRQIAKRMRELHDGIELTDAEVKAGPFVWQNIDKWLPRAEMIVEWIEAARLRGDPQVDQVSVKGHIVCSSFALFKEALACYRRWLNGLYEDDEGIKERLIFAHNDVRSREIVASMTLKASQAQYGNILRLTADTESPLLLPTNEHKRLIVIDFEYANANVPGLEFANHFVCNTLSTRHPA
jgi:choline kinase